MKKKWHRIKEWLRKYLSIWRRSDLTFWGKLDRVLGAKLKLAALWAWSCGTAFWLWLCNAAVLWAWLGFLGSVIISVILWRDAQDLHLPLLDHIKDNFRVWAVVAAPITLGVAIWRSIIAAQQITLARQSQQEDRFVEGIKLSASDNLAFRLGGLAALHALAVEDKEMADRIWDYLGGFLRNPPALQDWEINIDPETNIYHIQEKQKPSDPENRLLFAQRPDIVKITINLRDIRKKYKNFPLNLFQAHLEGAQLQHADLEGAHLGGAHLEGADLRDTHLEGAHLGGAHLEGADLRDAHLEGAYLWSAHLEGAQLQHAHLEGADLEDAHLEGADLRDAHLKRAHLENADLEGAQLQHADLEGAYLDVANLQRADLRYAHLERVCLGGAYLQKAQLQHAHLEGAYLGSIHFQGADLSNAHLQGAYLDVDFKGVNLSGAEFFENDLSGRDFSQTKNLQPDQIKNKKCYFLKGEKQPRFPDGWNWEDLGIEEKSEDYSL